MREVLLVFETDVIQQLRIEHDHLVECDRPRLRVHLWIIDRDVNLQASEIHAAEPFRYLRGFRQRLMEKLQPSIEERSLVRSAFAHLPDCS